MRRMEPSHNAKARDEFLHWQSGDYAYTWQGNGMLRSVTRPDGKTITFRYDALGRRIEKVFDGRYIATSGMVMSSCTSGTIPKLTVRTRLLPRLVRSRLTDQNQLRISSRGFTTVTAMFQTAKLVDDKYYSIVSDYIGRPVQAYDDNGNIVWQADYDIYGNLRNLHGSRQFIPSVS